MNKNIKLIIVVIAILVVISGVEVIANGALNKGKVYQYSNNDSSISNENIEESNNNLSENVTDNNIFEKEYTIETMLNYAIQDEFLARTEYEKIMESYGEFRPFTNIKKSEEYHISLLIPLFEKYNYSIPESIAEDKVVIPETLEEAFEIGVEAEIKNIEMYEKFLKSDLPEDIKEVFTTLKEGSENHLQAFENGLNRGSNNRKGNNR